MKNSKKRGFTIVELVIVIAVIAILAGVLIPTFVSVINKANESNDIQAARNMNTFLASAKVTDDVNSILDVYDMFEESGYSVENYKPLYKDRSYYYDKEYNQILYVDANKTVLFPTEHQGQTYASLGHNWMSLSMTAVDTVKPSSANYAKDGDIVTAKVATVEEYAYVVEEFNKSSATSLNITLTSDMDFMGANCAVKEAKDVTIKGEGTGVTVKNITSNVELEEQAKRNAAQINASYYSGGLISKVTGTVVIENVVIENINVKTPQTGAVGVIVGVMQGAGAKLTLKNVTVKNSSVIGHRDVGALVGAAQNGASITLEGNINIENVSVKTTGGRSALIVGKLNSGSKIVNNATVTVKDSAMSIYKSDALEQQFASEIKTGWNSSSTVTIQGQTEYVYSLKSTDGTKSYSAYGYRADALVLIDNGAAAWTAITSIANLTCSAN